MIRIAAVAGAIIVVAIVAVAMLLSRTGSGHHNPTPVAAVQPASRTTQPTPSAPSPKASEEPSSQRVSAPPPTPPPGARGTGRYFVSLDGNAGRQRLLVHAVRSGHRLATVPLPQGNDILGMATGRPDTVFVLLSDKGSVRLARVALSTGVLFPVAGLGKASLFSGDVYADAGGTRVAIGSRTGNAVVVDVTSGASRAVPHSTGRLLGWTPEGTALELEAAAGDRILLRHLDGSSAGVVRLPQTACHNEVLRGIVLSWTGCSRGDAVLVTLTAAGSHRLAHLDRLPTPRITSALVSASPCSEPQGK